jgi:hypothetical protein
MFAHSKLSKTFYQKNEKEQRKKLLDVSVGGLYNNRGIDLACL